MRKIQDPKPYIDMKNIGATPRDIYRKALVDGFGKSECMMLIAGVFDIPLHQAREVGHEVYREELIARKDQD